MGCQEFDKCDCCGQEAIVERKYFRYDVKCDCCNSKKDNHFEIVRYCKNCIPFPPKQITVSLDPIPEFKGLLANKIVFALKEYSQRYGYRLNTIDDLKNVSISKFRMFRNIGAGAIKEFEQFLKTKGIQSQP